MLASILVPPLLIFVKGMWVSTTEQGGKMVQQAAKESDPADDAVEDGPVPALTPGGTRATDEEPLLGQRAAAARRRVLFAARHQGRSAHC